MEIIIEPTTKFYEYFGKNRFNDILPHHIVTAEEIIALAKRDWNFHLALMKDTQGVYGYQAKSNGSFLNEEMNYAEKVENATKYLEAVNGTVYELKLV